MKKLLKILLVVILILNSLSPYTLLANTSAAKLDAVLVIDASLSMKTTDPQKLGLEAVKMFVDMLGEKENQVGVITYARAADQIYPMAQVNTQADKEKIKAFVNTISRNLNYTDISSGLKEAEKMLENRAPSNNKPLIVVFTDGNNDITGLKNRTYADIETDVNEVLLKAQNNKYPIYTVGLNGSGELNKDYLENISTQTGAKSFVTNNPADLPDILTQIFADNLDLKVMSLEDMIGTGDFEEVVINIPNSNVLEANISATSSEPIVLKLVNPEGVEQVVPSTDITLHTSSIYNVLKIKRPLQGDWKLYVKGVKGNEIKINLVYNYEMGVTLSPLSKTDYAVGEDLKIEAFLTLGGVAIEDEKLYNSAKTHFIIRDIQTKAETQVELQNTGKSFTGIYPLKEIAEYEIKVITEDVSFKKESETITFKVGPKIKAVKTAKAPQSQLPEKETKGSGLSAILGGLILFLAAIASFIGYKAFKKSQMPLVGQLVIEVKDNTTGKLQPPQYKKLHLFKGKVNLHTLLQYAPEFKETEKIILKSAPGDKVFLYNNSSIVIEKAGRAIKPEEQLELRKNDRLNLNIIDSGQTVKIEYLL